MGTSSLPPIPEFTINNIATNMIPGASVHFMSGENENVTNSFTTNWHESTIRVRLPAAATLNVSSNNANDTSAGTGVQSVLVVGILASGLAANEVVATNGLSGVSTVNQYIEVNLFQQSATGSGNVNAGIVYIGTGTITSGKPANVVNVIDVDEGVATSGFFLVPTNVTAYFIKATISSPANQDIETKFLSVDPNGNEFDALPFNLKEYIDSDLQAMRPIIGGAYLEQRVRASTGGGGTTVSSTITFVLLDNTLYPPSTGGLLFG